MIDLSREELLDLLKDEYLHIQKTIVDLDGRALTIKAWTVSVSLVTISGAFVAKNSLVFLLSAASAILFFLIEGIWKEIQRSFYKRSSMIEKYFQGDPTPIVPFQIDHHWYDLGDENRADAYLRTAFRMHVILPHIPICAIAVGLFILEFLGYIRL